MNAIQSKNHIEILSITINFTRNWPISNISLRICWSIANSIRWMSLTIPLSLLYSMFYKLAFRSSKAILSTSSTNSARPPPTPNPKCPSNWSKNLFSLDLSPWIRRYTQSAPNTKLEVAFSVCALNLCGYLNRPFSIGYDVFYFRVMEFTYSTLSDSYKPWWISTSEVPQNNLDWLKR